MEPKTRKKKSSTNIFSVQTIAWLCSSFAWGRKWKQTTRFSQSICLGYSWLLIDWKQFRLEEEQEGLWSKWITHDFNENEEEYSPIQLIIREQNFPFLPPSSHSLYSIPLTLCWYWTLAHKEISCSMELLLFELNTQPHKHENRLN